MKIIASIVLWCVALPLVAGAFTAELDKNRGTLDDQFVLTLTVNGAADAKPRVPSIAGLEIHAAGTSHNTSWVNGVVTREVQYRYVLTPTREGTYQIPTLELEVDGELARSVPLTLTVSSASAQAPGVREQRHIFITRTFSAAEVYVGEQIVETVKIFYRVKLLDAARQEAELLDFDVFKLGKERNYRQVIDGTTYQVIEVKRVLIPLRAGDLQVPREVLNTVIAATSQPRGRGGFFDDFFSFNTRQVRKRVSAAATTLKAKALPAPPAGALNLAVVGDYRVSVAVSKRQLRRAESATLTLAIEGYGNLQGIRPLDFKLDDFKVYADKPTVKVRPDTQKGLYSQAMMKLALQPRRSGDFDLGTLTLAWFHPPTGKFHTETVALGKLLVDTEADDEQQVVTAAPATTTHKSAVEVLGADLIGIHRGDTLLVNHAFPATQRWLMLATAILLLLAFMLLWMYVRFLRPRAVSRRVQAWRTFRQAQQVLVASAEQGAEQLVHNFHTFLGDKLGMQGAAATPREIHARLQQQQLEEDLCRRVEQHLVALERILFAAPLTSGAKFSELVAETNNLAGELEKKC